MKTCKAMFVVCLMGIFTFTNVANAFTLTGLNAFSGQLQVLIDGLTKIVDEKAMLAASSAAIAGTSDRTCQVGFQTNINGKIVRATTTMSGSATDEFAIALSVGVDPEIFPFSGRVQTATWGTKNPVTATVGYVTPLQYNDHEADIAALAKDNHYSVVTVKLDNVNNPNSGTTFGVSHEYAEAMATNAAVTGAAAGKVTIYANVSNCVNPEPVQDPNHPNIVFVLADDLDMQTMTQLPKLKEIMSEKGMTFENHFTSLSLCCPSRASILCGMYAHNNGVFTNEAKNADGSSGGWSAFQKSGNEDATLAVWLQAAGYKTALMGKYLNGYSVDAGVSYEVPKGWSEWAVPIDGDAYSQYNYTLNVNGKPEEHYLPYCTSRGNGKNCPVDLVHSSVEDRQQHFMVNVLAKKAANFVTESSKDATPFFLYLAPYAPHLPSTPAPRHEGLLSSALWQSGHPLPKTASFNESDVSDKPSWLKSYAGLLMPSRIASLTEIYQKRVISMYAVEDMLANLIDTLTENGQIDNTYIVFMSDNGFHLGQHRLLQGKLTGFDTDLRIPLIIRGPGVKEGSLADQLTANVDIAPTLASIAGAEIPSSVDGRSFKETLLGGTPDARNALLIEHADPAKPADIMTLDNTTDEPRDTDTQTSPITATEYVGKYVGVRTPQYTYIHYATGEEELYDSVNDPEQLRNVASVAGVGLLNKLRTWADDLSTCQGAACRAIESENRLDGEAGALDGKACFFNDMQINNGSSRAFYSKRTVEPGASCEAVKQVRSCTDGKLSGSDTYSVDSCTVLERFTGINLNRKPEELNLTLMNMAGANWMRANADLITYYQASTTYAFENWSNFKTAHQTGKKKGMINLMWDFERYGQRIPAPDSDEEKRLFAYLDTKVLPALLPYADIIVSGNEPFVNTLEADWVYDSARGGAPIAIFYKRVTEHLNAYMVKEGVRGKHKLYVGAFTRLYSDTMRTGSASYAVKDMLTFAHKSTFVDGVDIHTHVGERPLNEIESSLKFVTQYTDKPITNSEYTYVHLQASHLADTLDTNDTKPFAGKTFAETFRRSGTMLVSDYMKMISNKPVYKEEWYGFFQSRSWTVDHFLVKADAIFDRYPVNGATFGLIQTDVNPKNPLPWYMGFLYSSSTVIHRPDGLPEANYQYFDDFKSLQ